MDIAIAEGKVALHDTPQPWILELSVTPWGNLTLRDIINIETGTEEPEGGDDLFDDVYWRTNADAVYHFLATYKRIAAPGTMYNYLDENYFVTSNVLQRALQESV